MTCYAVVATRYEATRIVGFFISLLIAALLTIAGWDLSDESPEAV
jgi:hypothetical protein